MVKAYRTDRKGFFSGAHKRAFLSELQQACGGVQAGKGYLHGAVSQCRKNEACLSLTALHADVGGRDRRFAGVFRYAVFQQEIPSLHGRFAHGLQKADTEKILIVKYPFEQINIFFCTIVVALYGQPDFF